MQQVVFYPDCVDVFNISQVDGISYYILDKDLHNDCTVINRCNKNKHLNKTMHRCILHCDTLLNAGYEVVKHLGEFESFKISKYNNGDCETWIVPMTTVASSQSNRGKYLLSSEGDTWVITIPHSFKSSDSIGKAQLAAESKCVFRANSLDECRSFESFIQTRFVRFLLLCNIAKLNNVFVDYTFRFVPAPTVLDEHGNRIPGKFDHIYTDEELYKTFNLPQKYIDVIESVIKERK